VAPSPRFAQDGTLFVGALQGVFRWRESTGAWEHLLSGTTALGLVCLANNDDDGLTLLAGTQDDGILISRDGGLRWVGANPGLLDLTVMALAAPPDFLQDGLAFAATTSGLYRTRNSAESWRGVDLDWDDPTIQCLALSPDFEDDRLVLAGTEEVGLLMSDDGGRRWNDVPELADRSVNGIAFGNDGQIAAATDHGIALSADGGQSWRAQQTAARPGSRPTRACTPVSWPG
jgi:ligand-binding sensor domain-containing protein